MLNNLFELYEKKRTLYHKSTTKMKRHNILTLLIELFISILCLMSYCQLSGAAPKDWMPDPNLRKIVSEKLGMENLTIADMQRLRFLVSDSDRIESLEGLQHAVNLEFLHIGRSQISDLMPLTGLVKLHTLKLYNNHIEDVIPLEGLVNLKVLQLQSNQISDLTPLTELTNLKELQIQENTILDITPLAGLLKLEVLKFYDNNISDITPLTGLIDLKELRIQGNTISDITPLANLKRLRVLQLSDNHIRNFSPLSELINLEELITLGNPIEFYNILPACEMPSPKFVHPVKERITNREYPSTFSSHVDITNRPDLSPIEVLTLSDFSFGYAPFNPVKPTLIFFRSIGDKIQRGGVNLENVISTHREAITENPNMLFLVEIPYFDGRFFNLNEDSPYWLRNPDGTRAKRRWTVDHLGNEYWEPLLDFTKLEVQKLIIDHTVAVARCGLYDGIWLDRWHRDLRDHFTEATEFLARDKILEGIRAAVRDDFLIIVNTRQKIPRWASLVNGIFVETWPEREKEAYTHTDYHRFEESLIWYESNLRAPQMTLLRGEIKAYHDPMSLLVQRQMRVFTTLSLTHSDGYVTMTRTMPDADAIWYRFYEAPLGRPIREKAQLYHTRKGIAIEGLFIREFTNGWAVYNRSGKERMIQLPEKVSAWASGVENKRWHTVPDLDGEIYLKSVSVSEDVNADGIVNILDMGQVANAFGGTDPDITGDGVVNILDLVQVANAFSKPEETQQQK